MSRLIRCAGIILLLTLITPAVAAQNLTVDRTPDCPDNDGDAICNAQDACPDKMGPEHSAGCPDVELCHNNVDDDRDGTIDENCPDVITEQTAGQLLGAAILISSIAGYGVGRFHARRKQRDADEDE